MAWTFTDEPVVYQAAAGELLRSDPVRNTVLLSVLESLSRLGPAVFGDAPPVLGWWSPDGAPRAAVLQTPPWPMLLTALPGMSAEQLAQALADRGGELPGVNGLEADAAALAAAWRAITGMSSRTHQRQRLYRLGTLVPPDPPPAGAARIATGADAAVVGSWLTAFAAEIGAPGTADDIVADRLDRGRLVLWQVAGDPVSLAGHTELIAGVARIGPVYTPPGLRGRGYASGATAAASELAMARGATSVILFTDLSNPTSNSLYRRLGYETVEDRVVLAFSR
jgi:predicted GNAT family acetyltransferase